MQPKVTVVVPTYNREAFIEQCIRSVLAQSFRDFKLIVVDDASTDKTFEIITALQKEDPRVHIIRHATNSGSMNLAMKNAIECCETKYFTWLGSDDLYSTEDALQILVDHHERNVNLDYVSYDMKFFHGDSPSNSCQFCGGIWPKEGALVEGKPYTALQYASKVYQTFCTPFPWNGMWKTDFFKRNGLSWLTYRRNHWSPDTLNGLLYFSKGLQVDHLTKTPLVFYRKHEGQDTFAKIKREKLKSEITMMYALYEWFDMAAVTQREISDLKAKALCFVDDILRIMSSNISQGYSDKESLEEAALETLIYLWNQLRDSYHTEQVQHLDAQLKTFI